MVKLSVIFLTLSMAFASCHAKEEPYGFISTLKSIEFFFPSTAGILSKFIRLCTDYEQIMLYFKETKENDEIKIITKQLDEFGLKLNDISAHLTTLEDQENKNMAFYMKEAKVDTVLADVSKNMYIIDNFFIEYLSHINPTVETSNETIIDFAQNILSSGDACKMKSILPVLESSLLSNDNNNILDKLASLAQSDTVMCKREQSSIDIIQQLFKRLAIVEIKALIMVQYAFTTRMARTNHTVSPGKDTEVTKYMKDAGKRIKDIITTFKYYMSNAPRDFWNCEEEGVAYITLGPIIQNYIATDPDLGQLNPDVRQLSSGGLKGHNTDKKTSVDMCFSRFCNTHQHRCNGYLRECSDALFSAPSKICYDERTSDRRLNYVEIAETNKRYGDERACVNDKSSNTTEGLLCTCDEEFNDKLVRFFNLKDVTSDIHENKVVIGVKIVKDQNIIHLKIKQAKLTVNGNINRNTAEWKPIEKYNVLNKNSVKNRDYFKLTWQNRSVSLNTLDAPPKSLLTGLRFRQAKGNLMLEIRYTPFNFTSGQLYQAESKWHSVDDFDQRTPSVFDTHLPIKRMNMYNNQLQQNKKYIKFTTSDLESDLGQTVVPFIDGQSVTSTSLVSGAGLIHKVTTGSSGVLSLKLLNYDMSSHLNDEAIDIQKIIDEYKRVSNQSNHNF